MDLATIPDRDISFDAHVLTNNTIITNFRSVQDMAKMPDFRPFTNCDVVINVGAFMNVKFFQYLASCYLGFAFYQFKPLMIFTLEPYWLCDSNIVGDVDAIFYIGKSKPIAFQYFLITDRMKVRESV